MLVAQDVELDRIALKLSLDDFFKLGALTFQFDIRVAGDGMAIDSEKNVTRVKNASLMVRPRPLNSPGRRDRHLLIREIFVGLDFVILRR